MTERVNISEVVAEWQQKEWEATPLGRRRKTIDDFHKVYYDAASTGQTWGGTGYFGVKLWKMPSDLWLYQELFWQIRPSLVIETGTAFGGSALYFAHLMDQLGHGQVLSIDLQPVQKSYPLHPRISYVGGYSSTHLHAVAEAGRAAIAAVHGKGAVMVVLDSDHSQKHVEQELKCYASLVTPSSYLIVEDTNINGHPVLPEHGPGPQEALDAWLPRHDEFTIDARLPARMLFSMHTWLRRERT